MTLKVRYLWFLCGMLLTIAEGFVLVPVCRVKVRRQLVSYPEEF
jgi:hypothetical protein